MTFVAIDSHRECSALPSDSSSEMWAFPLLGSAQPSWSSVLSMRWNDTLRLSQKPKGHHAQLRRNLPLPNSSRRQPFLGYPNWTRLLMTLWLICQYPFLRKPAYCLALSSFICLFMISFLSAVWSLVYLGVLTFLGNCSDSIRYLFFIFNCPIRGHGLRIMPSVFIACDIFPFSILHCSFFQRYHMPL